jgi:hypothetical protein
LICSGLSKRLELEFYAGQTGSFNGEVVVATEKQIFKLPVSAYVSDNGRGGMSVPSHLNLNSSSSSSTSSKDQEVHDSIALMDDNRSFQMGESRERPLEAAYGNTSRPSTTRSNAERPFKVLGGAFKSKEETMKSPHLQVLEKQTKERLSQRQNVVSHAGPAIAPLNNDKFGPVGQVREKK